MRCSNCKHFKRIVRNHFKYFHKGDQREGISITRDLEFKAYEDDGVKYDFIKTEHTDMGECENGDKIDPIDISEKEGCDDSGLPLFPKEGVIFCDEDRDGYRWGIIMHENFGCIHFEHKDGKHLIGTMNSGD